ncbi:hypothetical protein CXG81DRAFT_10318 [Caulochytrium protostelioides]|uniref:asparagine synthase (glutamine-hydrolyzing) n=1 Tax=Caulochytrium protostelioides TaxID=1555241 RepID=A0A4P9XBQ7_9FUNG|nr:hypothetical protein CXG81DRAFT_10318 [Caulochytrium protostelioides]|eukprot:RKP02825.1 hypothetical protein CXG81DRAFT_10318 [Caulochytrium protostelioides]
MCGILAILGHDQDAREARRSAIKLTKRLRHRGPDYTGILECGRNIFCHERLSIVGAASGAQPLHNVEKTTIVTVNGEIYNHVSLRQNLKKPHTFLTQSDCEVIVHLYDEMGEALLPLLDGMFSFVLYDQTKDRALAARDPIGITTLYQGFRASDNSVWFASEMKALMDDCDRIIAFPPGHYYDSLTGETKPYYTPAWYGAPGPLLTDPTPSGSPEQMAAICKDLRTALIKAVAKRMMTEVPYGVLLSGGLDSSLIAAITTRIAACAAGDDSADALRTQELAAWRQIHSFSVGLPGSPDLKAARDVAAFLKTEHHEFTFTVQEGIDSIDDVIYHLETYDVTTVRASTPMYLLSRKIKALGVKMVLSGEGSDEIFGGYLYFHNAPSAEQLRAETVKRLRMLHTSDCLRANKSTMAWGLEARVPFLDTAFLRYAMEQLHPAHKLTKQAPFNYPLEKYILRKAFDTPENPFLPHDVLYRQKEQFSDGVGYSWIDSLKAYADEIVSDAQMAAAAQRFPHDTPATKEAYWYRESFERHFTNKACLSTVVRWKPRADWGCAEDPSGRAQQGHAQAYQKTDGIVVSPSPTAPMAKRSAPATTLAKDVAGPTSPMPVPASSPKKIKV